MLGKFQAYYNYPSSISITGQKQITRRAPKSYRINHLVIEHPLLRSDGPLDRRYASYATKTDRLIPIIRLTAS